MSDGERASAHLKLVFCSSEDGRFPATNLTKYDGSATQLAVWESEKFCEFPQELVFRVNRGLPTRVEQVNLLSHPFKVATRVEIFTSSATSDGVHDGKTRVTACELQEVQLPRPTAKITLLRLVFHTCHQTRSNLFSQVGLASVEALGPPKGSSVLLPMVLSPIKTAQRGAVPPRYRSNGLQGSAPSIHEIGLRTVDDWIQDVHKLKTPEQIWADIQIGKQLAQFAGNDTFVHYWVSMENEAVKLLQADTVSNTTIHERFTELEHRRRCQEEMLSQAMTSSRRTHASSRCHNVHPVIREQKTHDMVKRFKASQSQEREALLWQLADCSQTVAVTGDRTGRQFFQLAITDAEALELLITALNDANTQVFTAGCAFFRTLLTSLPYFQDAVTSKTDLGEIVTCLLERLDSHEATIRNAASFTILKVAGSTRTRGTLVTHLLLKHVENKHFQPSNQQLLALLKLLAALLLSFHCCANFDIAPRRILRFLFNCDAGQHENALVREAAKEVVMALSLDIDEEFVIENYVRKLPAEYQRRYDLRLGQNDISRHLIAEEQYSSASTR